MVAKLTEQVSIGVFHIDKYSSHRYSLHPTIHGCLLKYSFFNPFMGTYISTLIINEMIKHIP